MVGAVEGTHGDVAPAVRPDLLVYPEAERVGREHRRCRRRAVRPAGRRAVRRRRAGAAFRELDLAQRPTAGGITLPPPAFGAATVAGAFENTTPVVHLIPPFRPNFPKPFARGPHGAKWIVGGRALHDRIVPPATFPSVLPLQLLRIGPTVIAALPFEVTVESGRRVAAAVRAELGVERVAVSSLANEQFCYLTTPEEYALQRYEGGNTLYGPQSQPFVAAAAGALAADLARARPGRWTRCPRTSSTSRRAASSPSRPAARSRSAGVGAPAVRRRAPGSRTATGSGPGAAPRPATCAGTSRWRTVEASTADGGWAPARDRYAPIDDQGYHVGVVHLGARGGEDHYAVRWYTRYTGPARPHRFVVLGAPSGSFA